MAKRDKATTTKGEPAAAVKLRKAQKGALEKMLADHAASAEALRAILAKAEVDDAAVGTPDAVAAAMADLVEKGIAFGGPAAVVKADGAASARKAATDIAAAAAAVAKALEGAKDGALETATAEAIAKHVAAIVAAAAALSPLAELKPIAKDEPEAPAAAAPEAAPAAPATPPAAPAPGTDIKAELDELKKTVNKALAALDRKESSPPAARERVEKGAGAGRDGRPGSYCAVEDLGEDPNAVLKSFGLSRS